MEDLASLFGQGFSILWNAKLLGMPIMFWFVLVAIFGIIGSFLKVRKNEKENYFYRISAACTVYTVSSLRRGIRKYISGLCAGVGRCVY